MLQHGVGGAFRDGERVEAAHRERVAVADVGADGVRVQGIGSGGQLLGVGEPVVVRVGEVGVRAEGEQLVKERKPVAVAVLVDGVLGGKRMEVN